MVSYGLAYGMEAYGLSQRLGVGGRRGGGDPRPVLRRLSEREAVHGAHRRRGAGARLHRDPARPAPLSARARLEQLPRAPGRRAPGDERRHPGAGGGHLQGRARPPRRGARGARAREPDRAAGPRRDARRGASRTSATRPSRSTVETMEHAFELRVPLAVHVAVGRQLGGRQGARGPDACGATSTSSTSSGPTALADPASALRACRPPVDG